MQADPPVDAGYADGTLGIEEAARMLRLGLESMKELIDQGALPAVRLNQKHTVLLRSDLLAFIRDEGRRQAKARREARETSRPKSAAPVKPASPRRQKLPDLRSYETTGG